MIEYCNNKICQYIKIKNEEIKKFYKENNSIKCFYEDSKKGLLEYFNKHNYIPNDLEWNMYALDNNYLSSYSIEYISGKNFKSWSKKLLKSEEFI